MSTCGDGRYAFATLDGDSRQLSGQLTAATFSGVTKSASDLDSPPLPDVVVGVADQLDQPG
jgi:hypothetical protein